MTRQRLSTLELIKFIYDTHQVVYEIPEYPAMSLELLKEINSLILDLYRQGDERGITALVYWYSSFLDRLCKALIFTDVTRVFPKGDIIHSFMLGILLSECVTADIYDFFNQGNKYLYNDLNNSVYDFTIQELETIKVIIIRDISRSLLSSGVYYTTAKDYIQTYNILIRLGW